MEQATLIAPLSPPTPSEGLEEMRVRELWKFRVEGEAVPQGSWVPFISKTTGHAMAKPSNEAELNAWRKTVAQTARYNLPPWLREPHNGAVTVKLMLVRKRNDSDYLSDGTTLRKGAPRFPATAPDGDKCERAIWDALTGIAFTNDARIVSWCGSKRFADLSERPHVDIDIGFL